MAPEPVIDQLCRDVYKACMGEEKIEEVGLEPLREMLHALGGWPVLEGDAWDADDVKKFTRLTSDEHSLKTRISESLITREASERAAEAAERAFLKAVRSQYHGEMGVPPTLSRDVSWCYCVV